MPSPLGLVEDDDVFMRETISTLDAILFDELVNILDEQFGLPLKLTPAPSTLKPVPDDRLTQYSDQRSIARHESSLSLRPV